MTMNITIHHTAEVASTAIIGKGTRIWNFAQVREGAVIGENCILGRNVYVDFNVTIGKHCKIQNNCSIYHGAEIEDGVLLGPHTIFTNDKRPRAINKDGSLKSASDWQVGRTKICYGATTGANVVILPNVTIGRFAMVGSCGVVTRDVPDYALVVGNPAKVIGWVDEEGNRVDQAPT